MVSPLSEILFIFFRPFRSLFSREKSVIPKILQENETVFSFIKGRFNKSIGLLVSTNQRLIFIDKKPFWGLKVVDFYNKKVSAVVYETNLLTGSLYITSENEKATIDFVKKRELVAFAEDLKCRIFA
ncbi:MAG: PH domain-containing protein [Candidatus Caenarcaniphilales bacterium]|nr:PH domain-containing protein [Candidatus Caenarcaniphilales bacterium]